MRPTHKVMGKQKSCEYPQFVKAGGSGKMFGQSGVTNQEPGITSTTRGGKSSFGVRGGNNHMFGKQTVKALRPA